MEEGDTGDHFQNDVTVTDAGGKLLVSRTKTELDQNVAALYYDRTGAAAGNHNALVKELLGRLHLRRLAAECLDLCRDRRAERAGLLGLLRYQIR